MAEHLLSLLSPIFVANPALLLVAAAILTKSVSPSEYAEARGIATDKVLSWIRSGELKAVNVALQRNGRPRYRISLDAIEEFEQRRTPQPAPAPTPRRRREGHVREYV